jgi:hypothetical protein
MQPYQTASNAITQAQERPMKILSGAASMAISRVMPFLNNYVPMKLALSGLNKVDPRWGKFFKQAADEGYDEEEVRGFLKDKIENGIKGETEKQEQPKENRNIIEQYSPELHQFIDQEVRKGRPLIQAGAIAQNDKRFADVINKLQKDHKTPWSNILQSIYGGALKEQPQDQGQMQQGGGQNDIDPALQQLIQQGNSILQKFKGG